MQRTERTRVVHHRSLGLHCRVCPDQISLQDSFPEYNAVMVGKSGAVWTGAGSLTLSRSHMSYQNSISALYSDRAPVQPALRPLCTRCTHVLFAGSVHSMCNDAQSRLAYIIYSSQTEQAGCDEWQSRITMECECDSHSLSFFLFLYYAYPIILNDCVEFISFSLLHFSLC